MGLTVGQTGVRIPQEAFVAVLSPEKSKGGGKGNNPKSERIRT